MSRRSCSWLACALAALAAASCSNSKPHVGGETHWLLECTGADDCGDDGLDCICGVCTRVCSGSAACADEGDAEAACFDRSSPLLVRRCDGTAAETATGVCLAECESGSECGTTQQCVDGACVPARSDVRDAGSYVPSREEIDSFLDASTDLDWSTPIEGPALQVAIAFADERLTGTWVQRDCDPANPESLPPYGCVRLTIGQDATGAVTGHLQIDRTHNASVRKSKPTPFPDGIPEVDPEVGYPPGVNPIRYSSLVFEAVPGIPHRILDGRFENGQFAFTWSNMDLWHDWCTQQTSYRWMVGDHAFSFCMPPDREQWEGVDDGKLALCTSADFEPLCDGPGGSVVPCMCTGADNPRCGRAYCACTDAGCDADVKRHQYRVELSVQGDAMTGTWSEHGHHEFWSGTLQRVMQ